MVIKKWYKRWGAAERLSRESSERTGGDSGGGFARWLFPAPGRKGKRMSLKQVEKPVFTALGVALAAVAVVGVTRMALAEPPADATFKGRTLCLGCHSKLTTEITDAYAKTAHPKALQTPDQPGAVGATFDEDSPFKKEDIAYVLGVGKRQQAYVGKDGKLAVDWSNASQRKDMVDQIVPGLIDGINSGDSSDQIDTNTSSSDTSFVNGADQRLTRPFLNGFTDSVITIYWVGLGVMVLAFVLTLFYDVPPLRNRSALQEKSDLAHMADNGGQE